MAFVKAVALLGFEHNGKIVKGQSIVIDEIDALKLASNGLIEIVRNEEDMKKKELSSVSLADQASHMQIAKQSENGVKKKRRNRG